MGINQYEGKKGCQTNHSLPLQNDFLFVFGITSSAAFLLNYGKSIIFFFFFFSVHSLFNLFDTEPAKYITFSHKL